MSTVHAVLDRHGLVNRRERRRYKAQGTALSKADRPNQLRCADHEGEFMLADRRYCYPLTISDFSSRYLLACDALSTTKEKYAFVVFERVFKEFGLPKAIRTDNGVPSVSPNSLFGSSRLSVWGLRLGIQIERIRPGHPEQNGRHERMHLTLKKEATQPAGQNFLEQQAKFDAFIDEYNRERPHQALDKRFPAELYARSRRTYRGLEELDYPLHDKTVTVTQCGRVCFERQKIHLSTVVRRPECRDQASRRQDLARQLHVVRPGILRRRDLPPGSAENPFGAKVLPMSPE